jgi:hypothetical protein
MKIRDSPYKKMRKQPNINNICKYKVQRNKVNDMIIHAKQQFFLNSNDFLDENSSDPKLFWSLVKKLMGNVGRSCTMPPLLDTENYILCVDDIDIIPELNHGLSRSRIVIVFVGIRSRANKVFFCESHTHHVYILCTNRQQLIPIKLRNQIIKFHEIAFLVYPNQTLIRFMYHI